jgi:hypothetical protein
VGTLARAIAGGDAGRQRYEMACLIAAAQIDVARVRRARCDLLAGAPLDDSVLIRAAALDRYERRALSRRKLAIRQFRAACPLTSDISDKIGVPHPPRIQDCLKSSRPKNLDHAAILAKRTRRIPVGRHDLAKRTRRRLVGRTAFRPNEPRGCRSGCR